jgi:hypothetical protein
MYQKQEVLALLCLQQPFISVACLLMYLFAQGDGALMNTHAMVLMSTSKLQLRTTTSAQCRAHYDLPWCSTRFK